MIIAGAGMAGLLAANMLRHRNPQIYEKQSVLPNNHNAVLRFRSSIVGDVLNIPFKRVHMIKSAVPWKNPVADNLIYSWKNTGIYRSDRSIVQGLVAEERFIAPQNLVEEMFIRLPSNSVTFDKLARFDQGLTISTIPMPDLMRILEYPKQHLLDFHYRPGTVIRGTLDNCEAYVSLLIPDPELLASRASITGNELIVEIPSLPKEGKEFNCYEIARFCCKLLGVHYGHLTEVKTTSSRYAKILPVPDELRKEFMHWATDEFGIYSLGRFATWRPRLLMDDLVKDIRLIDGWISGVYNIGEAR